jgi:type VI secretion system protein ImpI
MPLTLELVNEKTLPDGGPVSIQITGKRGIDIGRAAHLDWTLPDPTRYVSSKHCEVRYRDGAYWLHDVSTNGTFVNGAPNRMAAPHQLCNGDRFTVGHYIVAVTIDGEEGAVEEDAGAMAAAPAPAARDQGWWVNEGDVPPPIDPKELRAARQSKPVHADFLDWTADVPSPLREPSVERRAEPSNPVSERSAPDMDWAEGPPSRMPTPPPPPPPVPTPRRPADANQGAWQQAAPPPPIPMQRRPADTNEMGAWQRPPIPTAPEMPSNSTPVARTNYPDQTPTSFQAADLFLRELAKAAGLPDDLLMQMNSLELAQEIGSALRLSIDNLMQLLSARQQAKRLARSSSHTVIQAMDNNPLKFSPSVQEALSVMFGPKKSGYLDARRAIAQGFDDIKAHQLKTYAAMQHALTKLMTDLDPKAIERETEAGAVSGILPSLRQAKLWDAYKTRWEEKVGRQGEAVQVFMRYFGEYYDRDGG